MKREGGLSPLLPPFLPSSVMVAVYLLFMMMDFVEEEEEKEGDREGERSEVRSDASESKVVHFTILGGGNREAGNSSHTPEHPCTDHTPGSKSSGANNDDVGV